MKVFCSNWFYIYGILSYLFLLCWFSGLALNPPAQPERLWYVCLWIGTFLVAFLTCYRPCSPKRTFLRCLTLGGSALWLAQATLPGVSSGLPAHTRWLRTAEVCLVLICEGTILVAILRVSFGRDCDPRSLEAHGIPSVLARLMIAEARFWRHVLRRLNRK